MSNSTRFTTIIFFFFHLPPLASDIQLCYCRVARTRRWFVSSKSISRERSCRPARRDRFRTINYDLLAVNPEAWNVRGQCVVACGVLLGPTVFETDVKSIVKCSTVLYRYPRFYTAVLSNVEFQMFMILGVLRTRHHLANNETDHMSLPYVDGFVFVIVRRPSTVRLIV